MGEPSYGALALRMLFGLIAVAAVAIGVLRLYAKRVAKPLAGQGGHLKVIDRCELEPGRTLHLVQAPGRDLVIATDPGGSRLIAEIEHPADPAGS